MAKIFSILFIGLFVLMVAEDANAQIRPYDNGEIVVLKKGASQSDNYYNKNSIKESNQHNISTLFRYGLGKNYELQFTWSAQKDKFGLKSITSESANVGLKIYLTKDSKYVPALSAIVSTNLTFDPEKNPFSPSINVLFDKSINSIWCVNGNVQLSLDEQAGELTNNYSFNIEAAITNWQSTYVGLIGSSDPFQTETSSYQQYVEIGMLIWLYDGITLYPFYDIGLNDSSGDIFNIGALFTLGR